MTRFFLGLVLPFTLLFTAALAVIRAQSYDDSVLRALLLPESCPAPCFMGIRPGVTTVDVAARILEEHQWVEQVKIGDFAIVWLWNGNQPDYLYNTKSVRAGHFGGVILLSRQTVQSIILSSQFSLGDLYLIMGRPNRISNVSIYIGDYVQLIVPYQRNTFSAEIHVKCPVDGGNIWHGSGNVVWSVLRTGNPQSVSSRLSDLLPMFRRYDC